MTRIQYQVSLFQAQRIGSCIRPLLQHFIANAPHDDTRMVAVTLHEIGEVTLVPLIEETSIVVLRLLSAPHIKALVHHHQAHGITHVQEFWSWRVMTATNGIHAHILQDG